MIKKIVFLFSCLFSMSCFALNTACPQAEDTSSTNFCKSFKDVAKCHCMDSGMGDKVCSSMFLIYNAMIAKYKTVERACEIQKHTTKQICLDDWKCYREGGKDSRGKACSGTGKLCERI